MLSLSILAERLKGTARRRLQVAQIMRGIEVAELAARDLHKIGRKALADFSSPLFLESAAHPRPAEL